MTAPHSHAKHTPSVALGLVGSAALHALLVLSLVRDLSLPVTHLNGAMTRASRSSYETVITAILIDEPSISDRQAPPEPAPPALRDVTSDLRVVILGPDASAAVGDVQREVSDNSSKAAEDQAQRAVLYGRYLGQVQARIERAWLRPRSDIGAPSFSCRARVTQVRRGYVVGVQLEDCNGTARWQASLVSAIQAASPLPAPPDPSVYADRVSLSFTSDPFRPGGDTEGFEPVHDSRVTALRDARQSFEDFTNHSDRNVATDSKDDVQVLHLTIIGTPSSANPPPDAPSQQPTPP